MQYRRLTVVSLVSIIFIIIKTFLFLRKRPIEDIQPQNNIHINSIQNQYQNENRVTNCVEQPQVIELKNNYVKCPSKDTNKFKIKGAITKVAIVVSLTTSVGKGKMQKSIDPNRPETMVFFRELLPSFCKTASPGFLYTFYIVYDYNDNLFVTNTTYMQVFTKTFQTLVEESCKNIAIPNIVYSKGYYDNRVSLAQNDGVMMAHRAGNDFFYRINDDAIMESSGWTEAFIKTLANLKPPNFGVVGPNHKNGVMTIMVFDFTHRLHVDMLGYHYPDVFANHSQDDWITMVYQPNHSIKHTNVTVTHDIMSQGRRYKIQLADHTKIRVKTLQRMVSKTQKYLVSVLRACYKEYNVTL